MGAITPLYQPGRNITGKVTTAAVVGGRFVMQAAAKATTGDAVPVKYTTASTDLILGVTHDDGAVGDYVDILGPGHVVPVEVGTGGVTFGTAVMADATGKAIAHSSTNVKAGVALDTQSAGAFALVRISQGL